jgi:hypothetical protein
MFKTFANTMDLLAVSWRLLNANRTLLVLPAISGVVTILILLLSAGVLSVGGAFEGSPTGEPNFRTADYLMFALIYFVLSFTVIYFNAALVASAHDLLEGRTPSIAGCLDAAYAQLPTIFGWACFATTVGLIIERIRSGGGVFQIVSWILDAIWTYATYFVVPVLVIEGLSPFDALKRSTGLFHDTWGKQLVANFGFGLAYLALVIIAIVPVVIAFMAAPALGIVSVVVYGVPVIIGGTLVLYTMEGIFRTALYRFATTGEVTGGFSERMMRGAYVNKNDRGTW